MQNLNQLIPQDAAQLFAHRPLAAWAMNDALDNAELARQLHSFRDLGYGGVMVIPWGGLPNEFMDDAWLASVEHILDTAAVLGMEVWLWDDWLFPSGFGAGVVTEEPAFRSKKLRLVIDVLLQPGDEFQAKLPPRAMAAAAFTINKFGNPTGAFKAFDLAAGSIAHTASGRERLVVAAWDEFSGMTYTVASHTRFLTDATAEECDICTNCDTEAFSVDLLNDDATRRFIELIHERYLARVPHHFGKTLRGFFYDEPNIPSTRPWSTKLSAAFAAKKGYALEPHLAEMLVDYRMMDFQFDDLMPERVHEVRSDYADVWSSMMAENFFGVIRAWCHEHGVQSIGHLGSDDQLPTLLSASGMYFKNMAHVDIPGVDIIFEQIQVGVFMDMPRMAGSRARMHGLPRALSESFASMGHGMHPDLMRYVFEHQLIRGINKFFLKLVNYNPQKSWYFHPPELSEANELIKRYGPALYARIANLSALLSSGRPPEKVALYIPARNYYRGATAISAKIDDLARQLTYNQWEFDYVWDADIQAMELVGDKLVNKSGDTYGCVIVPPQSLLEDATTARLRALGDRVVTIPAPHAGGMERPVGAIGRASRTPLQLVEECMGATRTLRLTPAGAPVSIASRAHGNHHVHLLLNESAAPQTIGIAANQPGTLYDVDPATGALTSLDAQVTLQGGESKLVLLTSAAVEVPPSRALPLEIAAELNDWSVALPDGSSRDVSAPLPTWEALGFPAYHGPVTYRTAFHWDGGDAVLSLGELCYAATVRLDGAPAGDVIYAPFQLELPALAAGRHELEIEVLNTPASALYGSEERFAELKAAQVFKGTYDIIYEAADRKRLRSGLIGPVRLYSRP